MEPEIIRYSAAITPFSILPKTLELIPLTTVIANLSYAYYGLVSLEKITYEASDFVAKNSNAKASDVETALYDFIRLTKNDYFHAKGAQDLQAPAAAWFTIRMTKPTSEYTTIPRWHRDGRMFDADNTPEIGSKYAITLLGKPTRLLVESELVRTTMIREEEGELDRYQCAEQLASEPLVGLKDGQIIRFTWGQKDSPVHSEPDMSTDRVFVSVLYGSEEEIRCMCEFRDEMYREES
ncbi:hypothetical protein BP6252_13061 [Coleophoma cylindrospora]|uniref:Uncharacterized protein n=1 Tax=Coleophoma cylindrospora TaxID=1849047 RepID=A0A3D8Q9R7_9HELO|nr:hypothetical protein BP6252_13061 [Coleophoma cylindrospora]